MSAFTVHATLKNPDDRQRAAVAVDFLVDTGAIYTMLPGEVVTELGLATPEQRTVEFANGQRDVWPLGEVRIRLGDAERTTVFFAGPPGCRPLIGAVTLEEFGVAVGPNHQRLVPISSFFV
jgi:clan AA aspartic protease